MEDEKKMPDLLDLQEFDEEALKKESEQLLQMRFMTRENAVFSRTSGGFAALSFDGKEYARVGVPRRSGSRGFLRREPQDGGRHQQARR